MKKPYVLCIMDGYGSNPGAKGNAIEFAKTPCLDKIFAENPKEFDPRKYLKPAIEEMQKVCEARYISFGAAGQADKIKVVPMSVMAKRYANGEI